MADLRILAVGAMALLIAAGGGSSILGPAQKAKARPQPDIAAVESQADNLVTGSIVRTHAQEHDRDPARMARHDVDGFDLSR